MLDRVLKIIITVTLLVLLLRAVAGVLVRLTDTVLRPMSSALGALGGVLAGLLALAGLLCLTAGLLMRARQFVLSRDARAARDRVARERTLRTRVRRPAEDAPVHVPDEPQPDPDPAINEEG